MGMRNWEFPKDVAAQDIIDAYEDGMSGATIIREFMLDIGDVKTLLRWLTAQGVTIRPRGFTPKEVECPGCGESFSIANCNHGVCKTCAPDKSWASRYYNHGITKPQFDEMLEKQSGLCDLCELPLPVGSLELVRIDHCHKQGHVRALLHNKCNIGLHYIEDDKFFAAAIKYVERHRR